MRAIASAGVDRTGPLYDRCVNWGRWGRSQWRPHVIRCSLGDLVGESEGTEDGKGDKASLRSVESITAIDVRDAEALDCWIKQMANSHKQVVRHYFYDDEDEKRVSQWEVRAALRHLQDLMDENRRVVDRMRSFHY